MTRVIVQALDRERMRTELRGEFRHVVGEERRLVAGARDGDVGEAGVEQVRVDAGIGVNEDAFGGKALGAVTGNGVAVVEMTMLVGSNGVGGHLLIP
jgi:hypothetical protein